jgi:hypothetical protein
MPLENYRKKTGNCEGLAGEASVDSFYAGGLVARSPHRMKSKETIPVGADEYATAFRTAPRASGKNRSRCGKF